MIVALGSDDPGLPELKQALQRLVRRIAMMLEAEKCVFLLHDRNRNEFVAHPPALGFTLDQVGAFHLPADRGASATVFITGEPTIIQQGEAGSPVDEAWMQRFEVRNLVVYPLVTDYTVLGVLHIMNKRGQDKFTEDDLRLLSVMARQVSAIITKIENLEL